MLTIMKTTISTIDDVHAFFKTLSDNGLLFHPEDSPHTVINSATRKPLFTQDEAENLSRRIDEISDTCEEIGVDPCDIALMYF